MPDTPSSRFDELLADACHEPTLLIPGARLAGGRFVVRALLGTGGMGAVYRATDTRREQDVAVKVLARVEADGIYRLKQEFRSLCSLDHPNVVGLHELHCDGGTWFFTMDLVAGAPLCGGRWRLPELRGAFRQLADAIHAIHRHGKLHRDLKPSNVMVTPHGRVVLLDFGLASDLHLGGTGQTLTDDGFVGTPTYMAPEQASGRAVPETDWYGFGTMLYEVLFGAPPFPQTGLDALLRKREVPAALPPHPSGDVPEELGALCLRLLDRDATRRPGYPEIVAALGTPPLAYPADEAPLQDPFVGREPELAELERALIETDRGQSAVVTVSGGPGIGKTRLVGHFLEGVRARQDGVVLAGQCPKWEHVPFRACDSLVDDLSRYLRALPAERAAALLPRAPHAMVRLFPVLGRLPVVRAIPSRRALPQELSEIRRLGLAALRELVGNIAAQERLVVFVDDMQWSDVDGARLLASLVSHAGPPDPPAMLLIVAHRTQDDGDAPGLAAFRERLAESTDLHLRSQPLGELREPEARGLAERLLAGKREHLAARIASEAGGTPLYIRQLVRHVMESGAEAAPLDLDGLLGSRLASLPPRERGALAAICLSERPVSLDLLARVTGETDPEPAVRSLVSAQLARLAAGPDDPVAAFHERVREVMVQTLDERERRTLHGRFVEALEHHSELDLVALTRHLLGSGRRQEAAASAVRAAACATEELAFEQAVAMYELGLTAGDWRADERIDLVVRLAEALVLDRRSGEAGTRFLQAAGLEADKARRRTLRLRAVEQFLAGGWLPEGIGILREILAELGLDYDVICGADLRELRGRLARRGLGFTPRSEAEIAPEVLARLEVLHVAGSGLAWIDPHSVHFRFLLAEEALEAGDPVRVAIGLRTVARLDASVDPERDEVYRVVQRLCEENPGSQADLIRQGQESGLALVKGVPWDQLEAGRRSEELLLGQRTPHARAVAVARYHQAIGLYLLGETQELRLRCQGWLDDAEERKDLFLVSWLNATLAAHQVARDRTDMAREMCQRAQQFWESLPEQGAFLLRMCCSDVLNACDVYDGHRAAFERLQADMAWFDGSPLARLPFMLCFYHWMRARAALAAAQQERPGSARCEELLREVEASSAIASRPRSPEGRELELPHYRILSHLLDAGTAALRGEHRAALDHLSRGLDQMGATGAYALRSAHARRARGLLLGGAEGQALIERAEADLGHLGVERPARHARAVLPGFPVPDHLD